MTESNLQTRSSKCKEFKPRDSLPLLPVVGNINAPNYASINNEGINPDCNDVTTSNNKKLTGQSTLIGVTFNLFNALVGAGVLAIPDAYSRCGIFGGVGLMLLFAIICTYTLNLLIIAGHSMDVINYEDLGYECYGYFGFVCVSLSMFLLDYGVLLTCLIILGDSAFQIISVWGFTSYSDRQIVILIVSFVVIFPLCLRRDIAHIQIFSFFKICALILITVVIIYECVKHFMHLNWNTPLQIVWFDMNGIPFALGIFAFSFVCHDVAFIYYNSLKNPTMLRWTKLSLIGISSAMLISTMLSVPAYLTFTDDVQGNILNNYQVKNGLIILIRLLYVIVMALTYPIPLFVVRHICYAIYIRYKNKNGTLEIVDSFAFADQVHEYVKNASLVHHISFSCLIFFSTLLISLFVDDLGKTMAIIGSLSSVNLAFVFPCLFYIKVSKHQWLFWQAHTIKSASMHFLALYPPLFLAVLGSFIGIYSVIIIVTQE